MKSKDTPYRRKVELTGRTAIVIGVAGILGRCCRAGLEESGASIAIIDLDTGQNFTSPAG